MSKQGVYGYPCVTDPNDFHPDAECSSPEEIERHRVACQNYGKPSYEPNKGCYSEHDESGQLVKHVVRTSWGLGVNMISHCDGCGEPVDEFVTCHECGDWTEFCVVCWPKHEDKHEHGEIP